MRTSTTTRSGLMVISLLLGLTAIPAQADAFESAADFALADLETASTRFTNSNEVDLAAFPIPAGYDQFQFTGRDGDPSAIDPQGWTNEAPSTLSFTATAPADEVILYAWFTNQTDSVTLRRAEGRIIYTTVAPEPAILTALALETAGFTPRVEGRQLDDGSTGGTALDEAMAVHALEAVFVSGDYANQTPDAAYVTLTNQPGAYTLGLRVINEAGNVAESSLNCAVTVSLMIDPPEGDRFVALGNLLSAPPHDTWTNAAATIQQAVDVVGNGQRILIAPGRYTGTGGSVVSLSAINKSLEMIGVGGSDAVVVDGEQARRPLTLTCTAAGTFDIRIEGMAFVNGSTTAVGGGIYAQYSSSSAGTLSFVDCLIADNRVTAPSGAWHGGGGLYWQDDSSATELSILRSTIERNVVLVDSDVYVHGGRGGGLFVRGGQTLIEDSRILKNDTYREAGGIWMVSGANVVIRRCEIADNGGNVLYPLRSGAFNVSSSQVLVEDSTLRNNRTRGIGGVTWLDSATSTVTLRNSLVVGNVAQSSGGLARTDGGALFLENCTVVGNVPNAFYFNGGVRHITNSILYYNQNFSGGHVNISGGTPTSIAFSCTTGTLPPDAGNISGPPNFVDPGSGAGETLVEGDYRLASDSPCINAGIYQDWMDGAQDLDGRQRIDPIYGQVDMGAYEYRFSGTTIMIR